MMNRTAWAPSHTSSSTSASPEKRSYGNQDPWSSVAEKEERSARPDIGTNQLKGSDHNYHEQFMESFSSATYSKWDDDRAWSSQEWKTENETYKRSERPDEISGRMKRKVRLGFSRGNSSRRNRAIRQRTKKTPRDKSERPVIDSEEKAWLQQFVIGNDEAELELSVESRSFVNRVNDHVRKKQKNSNVSGDGKEHSMIWGMFMAVTMKSAVFMGMNYQNNCHSIVNAINFTNNLMGSLPQNIFRGNPPSHQHEREMSSRRRCG